MTCGDYARLSEYWIQGQFFDAVTCPYVQAMPGELFALMVFAPIGLGLYIASGSVKVPLVVTIIVGAAIIPQLPGPAVNIAGITTVLGGALVAMSLVWLLNRRR